MDYTQAHEYIVGMGQVTNMDECFSLYYDETNNIRTFKLRDDGFNYDERAFYVIGGIAFKKNKEPSLSDMKSLYRNLQIQSNAPELKFRHIRQKAVNFLELLEKPRMKLFLDWLHQNRYAIHYRYIDNFFYTIVDIVDSMMESSYGGYWFNRSLKDSLYTLIQNHRDWFIRLLIEVDYPNIKDHGYFVNELISWIQAINIEDDFNLEYR